RRLLHLPERGVRAGDGHVRPHRRRRRGRRGPGHPGDLLPQPRRHRRRPRLGHEGLIVTLELLVTLGVFAPLLGAAVAGLTGRRIGDVASQAVTTGLLFFACVVAWVVFSQW